VKQTSVYVVRNHQKRIESAVTMLISMNVMGLVRRETSKKILDRMTY